MTAFMIQIFVAIELLLFLHVAALALAGVAFGVELREVSRIHRCARRAGLGSWLYAICFFAFSGP